MLDMNKENMKNVIWNAFPSADAPVGSIVNLDNIPYTYENYEGISVKKFFSGKKNTDVTLESLKAEYEAPIPACLFFMTPEAASYYLASLVVICIDDYYGADALVDSVMYLLSGDVVADGKGAIWADAVFALMNEKQIDALVQFLNYMKFAHPLDFHDYDFDRVIAKISERKKS